jgi:hypothetical protein
MTGLGRGVATLALAAAALASGCARSDGRIYDPRADAARQLEAAARRAAAGNKRVLAIIGGDW